MKFGVREICDVVFRAKSRQQIGNKIFYKNEPVIYFDTLKTSSVEGAATQVYAQGGKGNPRLVGWEGERTLTFTMEDALISAEGFMILSGAGLVEATDSKPIYQHLTQTIDGIDVEKDDEGNLSIPVDNEPYLPTDGKDNFAYVMFMRDGDIITEPYIPTHGEVTKGENGKYMLKVEASHMCYDGIHAGDESDVYYARDLDNVYYDSVLVDYYTPRRGGTKQIEITADKFGGNFYVEASTLFRDQTGVDMPAEFVIPNAKIQSNFTFTMASSGDPSSFTFTLDAFPDYTRFDHSKKVFAALQIIEEPSIVEMHRGATPNGDYDASQFTQENTGHEDLHGDSNG